MQSSRVLLSLVLVALCLVLAVVADPGTSCAPVTIDTFAVTTSNKEGVELAVVNGTYPQQFYYVQLATGWLGPSVFFNIMLEPNSTTVAQVNFFIALNGQYKTNLDGSLEQFTNPNDGATNDIEFTNWSGNPRAAENNTLTLNVTEEIIVGEDKTTCSYVYNVIFMNPMTGPSTGANIIGDPQFRGLRGQSFQVHGVDGAVYNLISDASMQLNTRFTFLEGPRPCAVMPSTGKKSAACWSHPGSYLSELALKTSGGSQLLVVSGPAATGFASVSLDGETLELGASASLAFSQAGLTGSVSVLNSHEMTIHAGHFDLVVENNDGFVNLRSVAVPSTSWSRLASHGLLGQTWQNKRHAGRIPEIEGDVDDYLVEDDDMFGDSFLYNRFTAAQ